MTYRDWQSTGAIRFLYLGGERISYLCDIIYGLMRCLADFLLTHLTDVRG